MRGTYLFKELRMGVIYLFSFVILFSLNIQLAYAQAISPIRIMPLGDSITTGSASGESDPDFQVSYRKYLRDLLVADGYSVDFVGSQSNGSALFIDSEHEGHGGWKAEDIKDSVYNWLTDNPADIILLHVGTNGVGSDDPEYIVGEVNLILDEIDLYESDNGVNITVLLARIINRLGYACGTNSYTTTYNDLLDDMAWLRIQSGDEIEVVDMECGAEVDYREHPTGDMWNLLHPFETGYEKLAYEWYYALQPIISERPYALYCSPDAAPFDGDDPLCDGGVFDRVNYPDGVYVYAWTEYGIASVQNFTTQCSGFYHERNENFAPWEAMGGTPITSLGACTVSATIYSPDGDRFDLAANFDIDDGGEPSAPLHALYCSADANLDAGDPLCDGGVFDPGVYVFVLPEDGIDSVHFTTQCNGYFHERNENLAPWEAIGGQPIMETGSCSVNATVYESDGGRIDLAANFDIDDGGEPSTPSYALYCSADANLDAGDPLCDGDVFDPGVYVFVLPEDGIDSVQFTTQCNDYFHEQNENFAPWEAIGGQPIMETGDCTINATVYESNGGRVDLAANIYIFF